MSEQGGPAGGAGKAREAEAAPGQAAAAGVRARAGEAAEGGSAAGPGAPERPDAEEVSTREGRTGGSAAADRTADGDTSADVDTPVTADAPSGADASAAVPAPGVTDGSEGVDGAEGTDAAGDTDGTVVEGGSSGSTWAPPRRFSLTRDTARPEGGGRAAPGDAPAPARQWPLLTVLCTAGVGLLIVGTDPFDEAFRYGSMLVGLALLAGAVLRWVVPSVGMLAVRSRFTDLVTYGLLGILIVLIALMAQPRPWLSVPFLQDVVHFTIR
ncbi:DUF3017 domain-containing protein [Streptomyces sp. NBC_00178]|nr:DUF3017 domain-containing protein [Streptomyces sp. NBC_00178]